METICISLKELSNSSLTEQFKLQSNSCFKWAILGLPSLIIVPLVWSSSPINILNWVDLPAPLEPTKPTFSPFLISQLIFFNTISVE